MSYFEKCLYFSANKITRRLNSIADVAFKKLDITPTQGFTLIAIHNLDKHTPSEIAAELEMTPSTITRFLDKLETLGYVTRTYLGKRTNVTITKKGEALLADINECWKTIHDMNVKAFGDETAEILAKNIVKANKVFNENSE